MKFSFDFEATQFSERIISIGCVASNGGQFKTLVKPAKKKDKVNKFITTLTGITNEMLENAPSADVAFNALFDFILLNEDSEPSEFYCYGDCDKKFIERTIIHMNDTRAVMFAKGLQQSLKDFSKDVKRFFETENNISLRKMYMLVAHMEDFEQKHDALEDAIMLNEVITHLYEVCTKSDIEKINAMKSVPRPCPEGTTKAPRKFVEWPKNLWEADTDADENNWYISAASGPHTKYFDSMETAVMWVIKYCTSGVSIKKAEHRKKIEEKITLGLETDKKSYSFEWNINKGE